MFNTSKTLIVVYKDELLMNQLKKLVESHGDTKNGDGRTYDSSIKIVSWTEKVWLGNKKAGNISEKVLFLGDIKGTDKLIPVIDEKFSDYGVKYGWAGNQAVLYAKTRDLMDRGKYDAFLRKLSEMPIPEFLKTLKDSVTSTNKNKTIDNQEIIEDSSLPMESSSDSQNKKAVMEGQELVEDSALPTETSSTSQQKNNKPSIIKFAKGTIGKGANVVQKVGTQISVKSEEIF